MKIYTEISLYNFEAWSGGEDTLNRVINADKVDELEAILEDIYPDGIDETALNDILRFESDWVYEVCGMRSESEICEELEEAREELIELQDNFSEECEEIREENPDATFGELEAMRGKLWTENYADDYSELLDKIGELEEELGNI